MVSLQAALVAMAIAGAGHTVLLDFSAPWCAPCRAMNPTVDALIAAGYPVQRLDFDRDRLIAAKLGVKNIPCFIMIVNDREVDRVVGGTTYSRLERMCKMGMASQSPASSGKAAPPPVQPAAFAAPSAPQPAAPSSPFDDRENAPTNLQPPPSIAIATSNASGDAAILAASVRIRVEDRDGHSCGSGTIIDSRGGDALILTCGHIFRDSQGKGRIAVDLFTPGAPEQVEGRLVSYDLDRDIGLIAIHPSHAVSVARLAPSTYRVDRGQPVTTVGCNNGATPTAQHCQVNVLGPSCIWVAGQPVEGRSGGGLFSKEGYVIGVCNAADPVQREGYFAALDKVRAELDKDQLAVIYQTPSEGAPAQWAAAPQPATAPSALPPASVPTPRALEPNLAAAAAPTAGTLSPQEQAAMDEIHQRLKEGAEVVCIVRPRGNPNAKSDVFLLERASAEFVRQLAVEAKLRERPYPTSFEVPKESPKPHRILLEWSAPNGAPVSSGADNAKHVPLG